MREIEGGRGMIFFILMGRTYRFKIYRSMGLSGFQWIVEIGFQNLSGAPNSHNFHLAYTI